MKKLLPVVLSLLVVVFAFHSSYAEEKQLSASSKKMVDSLAALALMNPDISMDTPAALFGDYSCFHLTKGLTNMIHLAKNPATDNADIIMLVHAEAFISQGLKVEEFPQVTEPPYGPGMTAGQWYYAPKLKLLMLPVNIENAGFSGSVVPKVK